MLQLWRKISWVLLVCALLVPAGTSTAEETLRCAKCANVIRTSYYKADGNPYCSKKCLIESLPQCDTCGRRLSTDHLVWRNKRYCSRDCLEKALPKCEICGQPLQTAHVINGHTYCEEDASRPRCEKCGLPFVRGFELGDGRMVCDACDQSLLYTVRDAQPYYEAAQTEVARITGLKSPSLPPFHMVGLDDLKTRGQHTPADGIQQRGLYDRKVVVETTKNMFGRVIRRTEDVTETVYILYGLSPAEFTATAAHELTHDLLAEQYPELSKDAPTWVEEGLCQYMAAAVSRRLGNTETLQKIEDNTDPAYGDGYRWFKQTFGTDNWPHIRNWLDRTDPKGLPKTAPLSRTNRRQ